MDERHVDALLRDLNDRGPRRRLLAVLATLPILGNLVSLANPENAEGKGKQKKRCKPKKKAKVCADSCGLVKNRKTCRKTVDCGPCACAPATCEGLSATCGAVDDGCGSILQCGTCPTGQTCQGGICGIACGASFCPGPNQICVDGACQTLKVRCAANNHSCSGVELQVAINQGGTVYIGPGRYTGTFDIPQGGLVTLVGTGMGDDPATNTILDAQQGGHVLFVNFLADVSLKSLRLTGGNGCGGAGVYGDTATTIRVEECAIVDNGNSGCAGGGFFLRGQAKIIKSLIRKNQSVAGGGIHVTGGGGPLILRATEIRENTAPDGGGIEVASIGSATLLEGTIVTANTATNPNGGGGIFGGANSDVNISPDSSVAGNTPNNCTINGSLSGTCQ